LQRGLPLKNILPLRSAALPHLFSALGDSARKLSLVREEQDWTFSLREVARRAGVSHIQINVANELSRWYIERVNIYNHSE
jgi:hypothetical protein